MKDRPEREKLWRMRLEAQLRQDEQDRAEAEEIRKCYRRIVRDIASFYDAQLRNAFMLSATYFHDIEGS